MGTRNSSDAQEALLYSYLIDGWKEQCLTRKVLLMLYLANSLALGGIKYILFLQISLHNIQTHLFERGIYAIQMVIQYTLYYDQILVASLVRVYSS